MKTIWERHNKLIIYTGLLVVGVLYYLPHLMIDGIPQYPYEDAVFHLSRIMGLSSVWKSPVNFLNFHHNGLMVNIFYPWLTIYPAYLLYKIFGSYITAYKAYYLILTIITLFLAFDVMHHISKNKLSAFAFAVLYTFSSYRFENLFHRSAMGETTAITLWLLLFLGLYHVFFGDWTHWGYLTAGMALLSYTHNLSLMIGILITALSFLFSVRFWDNKSKRIRSLFYAAICTFFLTLGSLVPMLELYFTNKLQIPSGSGLSLKRSVFDLPTVIKKMILNDTSAHSVGLIVFATAMCLCLFMIVKMVKKEEMSGNKGINFFAITGIAFIFIVSDLLPWEWIGEHTFLKFLQIVWRLNICPTIFILSAFSYYLPQMISSRKTAFCISLFIVAAAIGIHYKTFLVLHHMEHTRVFDDYIISGEAASMDYAPLQAKYYRNKTHQPHLSGILFQDNNKTNISADPEITISEDGSVYSAVFSVTVPSDGLTVDLPVFRYSSQICELNGTEIVTEMSERGSTLIKLEHEQSQANEIRIYYRYTTLAHISHLISAVTAILLILYFIGRKRKGESYKITAQS